VVIGVLCRLYDRRLSTLVILHASFSEICPFESHCPNFGIVISFDTSWTAKCCIASPVSWHVNEPNLASYLPDSDSADEYISKPTFTLFIVFYSLSRFPTVLVSAYWLAGEFELVSSKHAES
jgi:hypothetical protein